MTTDHRPESEVLAPLDPSEAADSDQWPEYELHNARVYIPGDRADTVSLLLASEHHPLVVTGDVQLHSIPKAQARKILQQNHGRTAAVELSEVRSFAYGQYDDGNVALWAAGKAGWYTIKPARAYRSTYNEMIEGIKLLYFIADAYREERREGKGKGARSLPPYTAEELFELYAREVLGKPSADGSGVAAGKVYPHVDFLFASMFGGKEGIDWLKNPLYLHLSEKFPAVHDMVRQRMFGPEEETRKKVQQKAAPKPNARTKGARQKSVDTASTTSSLKRKRGRPPKNGSGKDTDVISLGSSTTSAGRSSRTDIPAGPVRGRRTRQQQPEPVAEEVEPEETAEVSFKTPALQILDPEISDSEEEIKPQDKRKSALRLKPTVAAKAAKATKGAKGGKGAKAATRSGKAPYQREEQDDSEDELASSPTGAKRRSPEPLDRRRIKRRHDVDEGIDMPDSPPASQSSEEPGTPDALAGASEDLPLAIRLTHKPDPVQEDTWVCALDGCTHKVYLASKPESQRLIREHYALHAYDDDERVKMVKQLQHSSLPVNHLMEKVRLQARVDGFPGSRAAAPLAASRFPLPISQRL